MSTPEALKKFAEEQMEFATRVLDEARAKNYAVVIGLKGVFTAADAGFSGDLATIHGLIKTLELEADVSHVNNIRRRRQNENAKPVGNGDSQLREGKGMVGEAQNPLEIHMLCVSELAEATEEVRNAKPSLYVQLYDASANGDCSGSLVDCPQGTPGFKEYAGKYKIEGEAAELADCVIRIFDYFGKQGWDLEEVIRLKHEYNLTRPYRHGNKTA